MQYLALTQLARGEALPPGWTLANGLYIMRQVEAPGPAEAWEIAKDSLGTANFDYVSICALEGTYMRNS